MIERITVARCPECREGEHEVCSGRYAKAVVDRETGWGHCTSCCCSTTERVITDIPDDISAALAILENAPMGEIYK